MPQPARAIRRGRAVAQRGEGAGQLLAAGRLRPEGAAEKVTPTKPERGARQGPGQGAGGWDAPGGTAAGAGAETGLKPGGGCKLSRSIRASPRWGWKGSGDEQRLLKAANPPQDVPMEGVPAPPGLALPRGTHGTQLGLSPAPGRSPGPSSQRKGHLPTVPCPYPARAEHPAGDAGPRPPSPHPLHPGDEPHGVPVGSRSSRTRP